MCKIGEDAAGEATASSPTWDVPPTGGDRTDGGDCLSDLATLRNQPEVFGVVASDPTGWRVIDSTSTA